MISLKRKTLIRVLIAEGILLAALSLLTLMIPTLFSSLLSFPLEQIALGMRSLSLTGTVGNGVAMLLIALSALIPLFFALRYPGGRETLAEKIALFVLALILPVALYGILNPGMFYGKIPGGIESYERALRVFLSTSVWTVLILFVVLRLIRLFRGDAVLFHAAVPLLPRFQRLLQPFHGVKRHELFRALLSRHHNRPCGLRSFRCVPSAYRPCPD